MKVLSVFFRYLIVALVALPGLTLFYSIFKPLTVNSSFLIFDLFFQNVSLSQNSILIGGDFVLNIIDSCVAGSAYYLLFALNMSVPEKPFKKRLSMIVFGFISLLILNLVRISFLGSIFVTGISGSLFDTAHQVFWLIGSTIFVFGVWFAEVKVFKIKEIPVYTDIKNSLKILKDSRNSG